MISEKGLSDLYSRCENSLGMLKEKMKEESLNFNEDEFEKLKKMSEINMTYLVFISEVFHDKKKRYILDEEYITIIEEFCEIIESL